MLGFKLEAPRRDSSLNSKTRPIYLDMQVSLLSPISNFCVLNLVNYRLRPLLTLESLMPCCLILQISMVIRIVGPMHMDGKLSRLWRMLERYHFICWSPLLSLNNFLKHLADLIGADTKDIVFTSGATETNNMAIKGVARFHKEKKRHVITTQTVSIRPSACLPELILL